MPSTPLCGVDGQIDEGLFMFAVFVLMLYVEGVYMELYAMPLDTVLIKYYHLMNEKEEYVDE